MSSKFDYIYLFNQKGYAAYSYPDYDLFSYGILRQPPQNDYTYLLYSLNKGVSDISSAISSSGNGSLSDGIWLAIIGALSAALFSYVQKYFDNKTVRLSKCGEATLSLIKELEALSINYWLAGYKEQEKELQQSHEVNIKALVLTLRANVNTLVDYLPRQDQVNKDKLSSFSSEIYDLTTGDNFESIARTPSKRNASAVARKCSEVKAILLKLI